MVREVVVRGMGGASRFVPHVFSYRLVVALRATGKGRGLKPLATSKYPLRSAISPAREVLSLANTAITNTSRCGKIIREISALSLIL